MKLVFEEPACTDCGACLSVCPKAPASKNILKCRHCPPETAPCKAACPIGAIREDGGILFIDGDECNGCGACEQSCPYGAIDLLGGKAVKCDLCGGMPTCIDYCPEEAIRFVKEDAALLGWRATEKGQYPLGIPRITNEEQALVFETIMRFREESKKSEFPERASAKRAVESLLEGICREKAVVLESDQFEYLSDVAMMQTWGYGPLDKLLIDDTLEEIAVIGLKKPIYVYKRGEGWLKTDCEFTDQDVFVNLVNKMARPLGRRLAYQTPRLNAVLPDGSRIHASMPPISKLELTIRKFRSNPISIPDLVSLKTFPPQALAFLWLSMAVDVSIIVAGNTASGKTSTLNALFSFVPTCERILIAEETPEINIPHKHKVSLLANQELGISMGDLAADSLRMRPDRMVVGEVRTPQETKALLNAITSGQARGSYATFHAHSANEAIARMASMGISALDVQSIGLVLIQRRVIDSSNNEVRRAFEISEIGSKDGLQAAVPIYDYDYKRGEMTRTKNRSETEKNIMRSFGLSPRQFRNEIGLRSRFISSLANKKCSFLESVVAIQAYTNEKEGGIAK